MWHERVSSKTPSAPRAYKLLRNSNRWLVVNALICVGGLSFVSSGQGGQRSLRSGTCILSRGSEEVVEACL